MQPRYRPSSPPGRRYPAPERASTGNFFDSREMPTTSGGPRSTRDSFTSPRSSNERVVPLSRETYVNGNLVSGTHNRAAYDSYDDRYRRKPNSSTDYDLPLRSAPPTRTAIIHDDRGSAAPPSRNITRDSDSYFITPASSSGRSERRKVYSIDAGKPRLVEGDKDTRGKRDDLEPPKSAQRSYHLTGPRNDRRAPEVDDRGWEITDPRSMFENTEPRWRPRRSSVDAPSSRRERPVSLVESSRADPRDQKLVGPPPVTRGLERVRDGVSRHGSLRNDVRSPQRADRDRGYSISEDDNYPVAPRTRPQHTEDGYFGDHPGALSPTRDSHDSRRRSRRLSHDFEDTDLVNRGFGIRIPTASERDLGLDPRAPYPREPLAAAGPRHDYPDPPEERRSDFDRRSNIDRGSDFERRSDFDRRELDRHRESREFPPSKPREREIRDVPSKDPPRPVDRDREFDEEDRRRERDNRPRERDQDRQSDRHLEDDVRAKDTRERRDDRRDDRRYEPENREKDNRERRRDDHDGHSGAALAAGTGIAAAGTAAAVDHFKRSSKDDEKDRPRDERRRDDLSRDDRTRDERPRDDRPRDDRPLRGDDRDREDRYREERPKEDRDRRDRDSEEHHRADRQRKYAPREDVEVPNNLEETRSNEARPRNAEAVDPDEEYRRRLRQEADRLKADSRDDESRTDSDRERERRRREREDRREERPREHDEHRQQPPSAAPPPSDTSADSRALSTYNPPSDATDSVLDGPMTDEPAQVIEARNNRVRIVEPPREQAAPKSILRKPTEKFPEDPNPIREGVAPLKDGKSNKDIPIGARWTKISRQMVNPQALEEAGERYEERKDCVIVLRVLTKEDIQKFADRTKEIRDKRYDEHHSDHKHHGSSHRDSDRRRDRDEDHEHDDESEKPKQIGWQ